jgi:hypothetical protein
VSRSGKLEHANSSKIAPGCDAIDAPRSDLSLEQQPFQQVAYTVPERFINNEKVIDGSINALKI